MRLSAVLVGLSLFALACAPATREQRSGAEHATLSSAGAAPSVGPEVPMDAPVQRSGGNMGLEEHAVAVDSEGTALIVWSQGTPETAARGARVDRAGNLLDPTGFTITAADGSERPIGVASNGDEWLVVSEDSTGAVTARRVGPDGTILDPTDIMIAPAVRWDPRVTSNGSDFLVSWIAQDSTGGYRRLLATRVLADGTVLDPDGILIAEGDLGTTQALSGGSTAALLTWVDSSGVQGARLGPDGTVLDSGGFTLSTDSTTVSNLQAAFDGGSWLVGWSYYDRTQPSNPVTRVRARAVGADGAVVGTEPLSLPASDIYGIASDGAGWSVLCMGPSTVHVSSDATTVGDPANVSQKSCESFAYNGAHWVFPCLGGSLANQSFAIDVTDVGWVEPLDFANQQDYPAAAYNGSNFLVVWGDDRDTQPTDQTPVVDTYATRLSPTGAVLDAGSFLVTHGYPTGVSSDGQNWLVVAGGVGRRVSALGQVLDTSDIVFGSPDGSRAANVGFNGENWLVVYASGFAVTTGGAQLWDLWAKRVSTAGEVLDSDSDAIHVAGNAYIGPQSITFDGVNWVVGWFGPAGMALSFVGPDGKRVFSRSISLPNGHTTLISPALGYDASGLFVAWLDSAETGRAVRASRVSSQGDLLDGDGAGVLLANVSASVLSIAAARYGADWLVTWNATPASGPGELDGAIFSSTETIIPFVVSATKQAAGAPALASGAGNLAVTYAATDALGSRVNARMIAYPCAGASDPLCEWNAASGGFAGAAAGAAGSGGEAGTAEVGGTNAEGGRPHVGNGGSSSGGTSHAGGTSSNHGGDTSESGGTAGDGEAGASPANGGTGGSPHGGAPSGGSKNKGGGSGTASGVARPDATPADSGCACRAAPASRSAGSTALIGLVAAAFATLARRAGLVRRRRPAALPRC